MHRRVGTRVPTNQSMVLSKQLINHTLSAQEPTERHPWWTIVFVFVGPHPGSLWSQPGETEPLDDGVSHEGCIWRTEGWSGFACDPDLPVGPGRPRWPQSQGCNRVRFSDCYISINSGCLFLIILFPVMIVWVSGIDLLHNPFPSAFFVISQSRFPTLFPQCMSERFIRSPIWVLFIVNYARTYR